MDNLPVVEGYTTSIRKETGNLLFSSDTDGWNFEYSAAYVDKLLANGELKRYLNLQHDKCINDRNKYK